jgi:alkaline phosphatase D
VRPLGVISSILFLLAPAGLSPAPTAPAPPPGILVTVGDVASDRAGLWLRASGVEAVRLEYGPAVSDDLHGVRDIVPDATRDFTARVELTGLEPATRYAYTVRHGDEVVAGDFSTAPAPAEDARVRLAWSADLGGAGHCRDVEDGYRIFDAMAARAPQLFLFLGDTIYADQTCGNRPHAAGADFEARTLAQFHAKHRYNRADRLVQRVFRRTPVFAVWDDHEVGNNFAGHEHPLMPLGRQAFLDYWPIAGPGDDGTRMYRSVRWGRHVEIFIVDTRQYRSPNGAPDGPSKTMLGREQRTWLLTRVPASDATWKLVVSTVPLGMFTGGVESDSWSNANVLGFPRRGTGFVHERDAILGTLRDRGVRNLVFLSGDVHHAELIRHVPARGFTVHEFIAGPLAARQGYPRPLDRSLRSRSLGSLGWAYNFGEIEADGAALTARIIDVAGAVRAAVRISANGGPAERVPPTEPPPAR